MSTFFKELGFAAEQGTEITVGFSNGDRMTGTWEYNGESSIKLYRRGKKYVINAESVRYVQLGSDDAE